MSCADEEKPYGAAWDALNDDFDTARGNASRALKRITGQDFGTDYAAWRAWWLEAGGGEPWLQFRSTQTDLGKIVASRCVFVFPKDIEIGNSDCFGVKDGYLFEAKDHCPEKSTRPVVRAPRATAQAPAGPGSQATPTRDSILPFSPSAAVRRPSSPPRHPIP